MSVELSSIPIDVSFMMAAPMGNPRKKAKERRLQKWLLHIEAISRALLDPFDRRPPRWRLLKRDFRMKILHS